MQPSFNPNLHGIISLAQLCLRGQVRTCQPLMKRSSLKEWGTLYISFMQLPTSSVPSPTETGSASKSRIFHVLAPPTGSSLDFAFCRHVVPFFCHPLNHQSSCFPTSKLQMTFLICHHFLFCLLSLQFYAFLDPNCHFSKALRESRDKPMCSNSHISELRLLRRRLMATHSYSIIGAFALWNAKK